MNLLTNNFNIKLTNKLSFFILITLFFGFFSCQDKTKELGLSLPNQANVEVFFTDTMAVETSTVFIDSVNTTNSTSLLVGKLNDPQLGVMTASSVFTFQAISSERFKPIKDTLDPLKNPNVDLSKLEASFVLTYSKFYGEGTGKQKFGIHTLKNSLDKAKIYNNKSGLPTDNFDDYNPISIDKTTTGHEFDIATDLPSKRLRIPLADNFRDGLINLLKNMPDDILTQELLETYLKGIVLVPDAGSKAILDFEATVGSTQGVSKLGFIELRYPVKGKTDIFYSYIITVKQPDLLSVYNARAPSVRYNKITVDRTGTPFSTLPTTGNSTIAPIAPDNLCVAQTGLGYYTKLTFPNLKYWKEKGEISVNRVDMVVFPAENSYDEKMVLPSALELVELDANGNRSKFTLNQTFNTFVFTDYIIRTVQGEGENPYALSRPLTLGFLSVGGYYSGNMTTYFQYMLNQLNPKYTASAKKVNNGLLLGVTQASSPLQTATTSSPVNLDRLILRGAKAPTKSLKLRVFYTKNK